MVIYIDDILLMGESKEQTQEQVSVLIFLLECLGFIANTDKTITDPTHTIKFRGFIVNTTTMEISLPP